MEDSSFEELAQIFATADVSLVEGCAVAFILFAVGVLVGLIAFHVLSRRCICATTDAPVPNSSPSPVLSEYSGELMLTAARASLPTPLPTNIPSAMLNIELKSIPKTVGMNNFTNSLGMFVLPKSILSLSIAVLLFFLVQR